jgi:hypothetical protein
MGQADAESLTQWVVDEDQDSASDVLEHRQCYL